MTDLAVIDNDPSAAGRPPRHAVRLFLCDVHNATMTNITRSQPSHHHPRPCQNTSAPTNRSITTNNNSTELHGPALVVVIDDDDDGEDAQQPRV